MSNDAPPEDTPVLFIDRDTWSRKLGEALDSANIPFVAHHHRFEPDAPDADWLLEVGKERWIIVTRDKAIRRRPAEIAAVRAAGVHVFALTSGNLSAAESASIIVSAWPHIKRAIANIQPPQLWAVDRSGRVKPIKR